MFEFDGYSFGFEAEYDSGADALIQDLFSKGLAGSDTLHSYHCGCEHCICPVDPSGDNFRSVFRGQQDSSCSGEIISCVFTDIDAAYRHMYELQLSASYTVDAKQGPASGFHVHVGKQLLTANQQVRALANFLLWEHVLLEFAAGSMRHLRNNNTPVSDAFADYEAGVGFDISWDSLIEDPSVRTDFFSFYFDYDRHSFLNLNTVHNTWEFRLWNSTRAAWRMQMFCGLSILFMYKPFIYEAFQLERKNPETLMELVENYSTPLADLMERQITYRRESFGIRTARPSWTSTTSNTRIVPVNPGSVTRPQYDLDF